MLQKNVTWASTRRIAQEWSCYGQQLVVHAAGYKLILIMPANMSEERRAAMAAFGAQLISVPAGKMELARDLAHEMQVR